MQPSELISRGRGNSGEEVEPNKLISRGGREELELEGSFKSLEKMRALVHSAGPDSLHCLLES